MESQQILELLLSMQAQMETNRQVDREILREIMKTNQDDLLKTIKEEMQATIGKMWNSLHLVLVRKR
jgi:predicted class III extradiol MEMO1 family dioxygenase